MLDAVVGGELAAAQREDGRQQPDPGRDVSRAAVRPPRRSAPPASDAAPIAPSALGSCIGSSASGSARLTSGITAKASASRSTPRSARDAPDRAGSQAGLGPRCDLDLAACRAHRGRPVRRTVHEQPVAQRHAAEPKLLVDAHRSTLSASSA